MNEIKEKRFKIDRVVFYKEDSHWGVLGVKPIDSLDGMEEELMNDFSNISMSGVFDGAYEGAEIVVSGDIVTNPKYGKQIQLRSIQIVQDTQSREGIVNFLAKSFIKGISTQNANKIYDKYKEEAIKVTLNTPEILISIPGIGQKTIEKVRSSVDFYKSKQEVIEYCTSLGINYTLTMKIIGVLGDKAIEVLKEDPYKIMEISNSISFKKIDEVFIRKGGDPLNSRRLEIGLLYSLRNIVTLEGSTGCYSYILKGKFLELLSLQERPEVFSKTADRLRREGKIEFGKEGKYDIVYFKEYLDIEKEISENVYTLETEGYTDREIQDYVVEEEIGNFNFTLNEEQVNAIHDCLDHRVSVLTGSAGCLTGDALIPCWSHNLGGYRRDITIKELYENKTKDVLMVRSLIEDEYKEPSRFIAEQIAEDVVYSGKKEVFELRLVCGRVLKATATHEIMTDSGFKFLKDLTKIDSVMIDEGSEDDRVRPSYSRVYSVTPLGVEDTYDICCRAHHNFVANGMVVHNSGKSSITKALYRIYDRSGFDVKLLSPTAKAARRLEECTGGSAQTIHKFIGMGEDGKLRKNKGPYPRNTVLIIDEASMMDILLFNHLLENATPTSRVLLVGDNNQLPSVQAGNVLGDLIASGKVHVSKLTNVMRQQESSNIIKFCTMINEGKVIDPCELPDFHYEEFGTSVELKELLIRKYLKEVGKYGLQEVQVITPYKQGEVGMNNLNLVLQAAYQRKNNGREFTEGYREGDRVRHIVNNYDKDVFNGETGIVTGYPDEELEVNYGDNKIIRYESSELEELTLSYASTVHASQGSEYAVTFVVLDDTSANDFLHIRRLLYTAVSRGKKKVYIFTKPYLVDKCIVNNSYKPRITKLKEFLVERGEDEFFT